jgi:hypothetical protein
MSAPLYMLCVIISIVIPFLYFCILSILFVYRRPSIYKPILISLEKSTFLPICKRSAIKMVNYSIYRNSFAHTYVMFFKDRSLYMHVFLYLHRPFCRHRCYVLYRFSFLCAYFWVSTDTPAFLLIILSLKTPAYLCLCYGP